MIVQLLTTEIHNVKVADMTEQRVENLGSVLMPKWIKDQTQGFRHVGTCTVTPVTVTQ